MQAFAVVVQSAIVDDLLAAWREALGRDAEGYRGHVYRVLNFARALAGTREADDAIAAAALFHDLGIWSDGTFDYLDPSARRAREHVKANLPGVDAAEVERMIRLHHKLTPCPPEAGPLAEALRRADLADVSLGLLRSGLPRSFVREVREAFPNAGFHRCLLRVSTQWIVRHPTRPLPMMKW
ncbi:Metal-dependent phosphohydrolase, HD subdomain protein [Minicystis rosea]|nr:Metal-dependent phosphohydrolase, HD subdomain protein [Minicystis rosea]